jgi:hypothetical protein
MSDFAFHEIVATAVARDSKAKWLQVFIDTKSHRVIRGLRSRFDLEPLAILTFAPL